MMNSRKRIVKEKKGVYPSVDVYISTSSNNTRLVAMVNKGDVIAQRTAGQVDKNTKKSTPNAASETAANFAADLKSFGVKHANVIFKGIFPTREAAFKVLASSGISINLSDRTGIPHNGTRPKGRRRV